MRRARVFPQPRHRDDPSYARTLALIRAVLQEAQAAEAARGHATQK